MTFCGAGFESARVRCAGVAVEPLGGGAGRRVIARLNTPTVCEQFATFVRAKIFHRDRWSTAFEIAGVV